MATVYGADGFVTCVVFVRWDCLVSRYMEINPIDWPPSEYHPVFPSGRLATVFI